MHPRKISAFFLVPLIAGVFLHFEMGATFTDLKQNAESHDFIDQAIGDWLKANGKDSIAIDCSQNENPACCYQWKGVWLGRLPKPQK